MSKVRLALNENVPGCKNFTWKEVLYLPQWKIHAFPTPAQYQNLIFTVSRLELIRKYIGLPIQITSGLRPDVYNKLIGGARLSAHVTGDAVDFSIRNLKADRVREILEPILADFEIRMEKLPDSNWVHIDTRAPGVSGRYFYP